jgi:hypothetical protein
MKSFIICAFLINVEVTEFKGIKWTGIVTWMGI